MNVDLIYATIRISEILRDEYNLSLDEAVKCIDSYGVINCCIGNNEYISFFLQTSFQTWAQRMYEHYNDNVRKKTK